MKKLIIIAITVIAVAIASTYIYMHFASFHKVNFTLSPDTTGATLFKLSEEAADHEIKGDEIQKVSAGTEASLQNGLYFVIPEGEKVARDQIAFTVANQDVTVDISPPYSLDYLKSALAAEENVITTAIYKAFPLVASEYDIRNGTMYEKADWYGALLYKKVSDPRDQRDFYRIIAHKDNGSWKIVNQPELILTKTAFKDVPEAVLRAVNKLEQ